MTERKPRTTPGVRKRVHTAKDGTVTTRYTARLAYRDGEGRRTYDESKSFLTKREAAAEYIRMKSAREAGTYTAPSAITLTEYVEQHWLPSIRTRVKTSTADNYERIWHRHLKPELGGLRLQRIAPLQLDAFYASLGKDRAVRQTGADGLVTERRRSALKPKTIRNVHLVILKVLSDAVDAELLTRNPATRAKPPRVVRLPEDEIQVWNNEELSEFLRIFRENRWFPEIRVSAMTGMRRAEVLGLRWKDIDFEAGNLTVRQSLLSSSYTTYFDTPKSHKPRVIDLDPKTLAVLIARRESQREQREAWGEDYLESNLVFTKEDGSLVHPDSFSQAFERMVAQTDLPRITLHGLRHTHATLLLKLGLQTKVVSERLGHADPGFTLRQYAHVLPSMQAEAATKISGLVDE